MLKEKKKQIIKAQKDALNNEMQKAVAEAKIPEPAKPAPVDIDKKKKIAEAVKAVIKSTQEDQEKLNALKGKKK